MNLHVCTDKQRLDVALIHQYLSTQAYWSEGIPRETVQRAIDGSLCVGGYLDDGSQVAFARVITDGATFGYLADVFVLPGHRGRGYSTALIEALLAQPDGSQRWESIHYAPNRDADAKGLDSGPVYAVEGDDEA